MLYPSQSNSLISYMIIVTCLGRSWERFSTMKQACRYAQMLALNFLRYDQYLLQPNPVLFGRKFLLVTDHKPLLAILGLKNGIPSLAAARLQGWAILLSAYQYEIKFKPTATHANADGLPCLSLPEHTDNTGMSHQTSSTFHRLKLYQSLHQKLGQLLRKTKF